jgi:hypothetical protein
VCDQRKSSRQRSRFQSFVRVLNENAYVDCVVRDISETGARLGFGAPASVGGDVELHIPEKGLIILANVVWVEDCECGLVFKSQYDPAEAAKAVLRLASKL